MAYIERWSVIGGDRVPAVMCVFVSVVMMMSISVAVLWVWSYLDGVVITVCKLFSMRKFIRGCVGFRRFRFRSPCIVIAVVGYSVCISSTVICKL